MLRQQRLTRKIAARPARYRARADLALASNLVFFGVLPVGVACGAMLVQMLAA